ncbi:hypothetical protein EMIHUDRAFT_373036 [Emiliania huxleyi CCMP1516]|uniref:Uncharacterized protein n=2 Tax=Emiliania huxleyi TaxID=2903 RepID=A0A0D3IDJ2_EMIH1|nr:hypothetical protein EMIHUDRAFT_358584 [Emiliania huxleyi CCMP1516]XP_005791128.1 hypothetical protein EMIHUDRAFT_373036 [Emiliania huxleyi CCMP1516]EOD09327.1 hypothetical protein EMIHUDRAFT_358584 [Emiliania huxleyi CCMP1516]EOD38699.1 hypothetical protein EMIHUDRAFT_373036 [Emiliania huxleyi CCMP1516]|eukprot:XP_005761756.1 hypothetical protein EMIHUDRAFT_358584 [Emiliania huxleyi CCMP1516]
MRVTAAPPRGVCSTSPSRTSSGSAEAPLTRRWCSLLMETASPLDVEKRRYVAGESSACR